MKKSTLFSLVAFLSPATQASALYFTKLGLKIPRLQVLAKLRARRTPLP